MKTQNSALSSVDPASMALFRRLLNEPDGIIYDWRGPSNRYVMQKTGSVIALYFAHPDEDRTSAIMSEIDLLDPLNLLFGYSRAFMLTLLWHAEPQRIYVIGFGGGRIPAILHHYYPDAAIEATEIDPDVVTLAQSYFGVRLDPKLRVTVQDGREYLEQVENACYDIILVDAFVGPGHIPHRLSTVEFYGLCKARLSEGGVVAVNLCAAGPLHRARIETFRRQFAHTYLIDYDTALVMFGTDQPTLTAETIVERTAALMGRHQFMFPLLNYAHRVVLPAHVDNYLMAYGTTRAFLRDDHAPR